MSEHVSGQPRVVAADGGALLPTALMTLLVSVFLPDVEEMLMAAGSSPRPSDSAEAKLTQPATGSSPLDEAADARSTVFIVDDDPAVRQSMHRLIESVDLKVLTFASANEFLDAYDPEIPGCLILEVGMPGVSGLDLQVTLRERRYDIPIIIVTGCADVPMAVHAMKNGAVEFLEKPCVDQLLLDHVQRAIRQDSKNRAAIARRLDVGRRIASLTGREREVLAFVVEGLSSKQAAARLNISYKTIESHRTKIMKKMQAKNVPHLVRMFLEAAPEHGGLAGRER